MNSERTWRAPSVGPLPQRVQRGVRNLMRDPQLLAELTGAPVARATYYYLHPNALRLTLTLKRALAPLQREQWFIGGTTIMEGLTLYALARLMRPALILELGVANGISSAYWLQGLHDNQYGHLTSLDAPPQNGRPDLVPAGRARGWVVPDALRSRWTLQLGDANQLLPRNLREHGNIDIVFDDCDHSYEHIQWVARETFRQITPDGLLLIHDVDWNAAFRDWTRTMNLKPYLQGKRLGILKKKK